MLTETNTLFARLIKLCTKTNYVHTSLILNNSFDQGFSFSRKKLSNPFIGVFKIEDYHEIIQYFKNVKCVVYRLDITDLQYQNLEDKINFFIEHQEQYSYNLIGCLGVLLNTPLEFKNKYFCSQFVSEVLQECDILDLRKKPSLTSAKDFLNSNQLHKVFEGDLNNLIKQKQKECI